MFGVALMAKKVSIKNELAKKPVERTNKRSSVKIDNSIEAVQERSANRELIPSVTYVNSYQINERGREGVITIDLTDLVEKYPQNILLINQLIVGFNAVIKPGCSPSTVKSNSDGIRRFIEFLNDSRNLSNVHVVNIVDINITVALSFFNYLLSIYPNDSLKNVWFSALRRIVTRIKELYRNNLLIGKPFAWPFGPKTSQQKLEGYYPKQIKELIDVCIRDIKEIIRFHETYRMLDKELYAEEWTLENLMCYFHDRLQSPYHIKNFSNPRTAIKHMINSSKRLLYRLEAFGHTKESICDLYEQKGPELALSGRLPFATSINSDLNIERAILQFNLALATIKKRFPLFPYYLSIDKAKYSLEIKSNQAQDKDPLWYVISKAITHSSSKIEFMNGKIGVMAVHASRHFVSDTIYPFFLLCLINTGWNVESLLSISDDVDSFTMPDLIDPQNYVLIMGTKKRGQAGDEPKLVFHRSLKNKMFSTYWLLKYVESIIIQYKDCPYYQNGVLWQYTVPASVPDMVINNIFTNLSFLSKQFMKRHRFEYFTEDSTIDHRKIRSGYVALRQLMGASERKLSEDLGHNSDDTIIYYTSDESSTMVQDIIIKQIQEQFVNDIKNYKVRIVESQSLQELRDAINNAQTQRAKEKAIKEQAIKLGLPEITIIHLLDASAEKYILACENARNPSWPGFEEVVKEGRNCRFFNKCCLCKQAVVFSEALPYIARRLIDLEKMQSRLSSTDWILQYGDEYDAWIQILNSWNNREQVEDAWGQARIGKVILPQSMRGV